MDGVDGGGGKGGVKGGLFDEGRGIGGKQLVDGRGARTKDGLVT